MANYPDFLKKTGFGTGEGLHGFGCRHNFSAGFDFTPPPFTEEQLAEMTAKELETKEYEWKDRRGVSHKRSFTLRQALDRQRDMERQMRATMGQGVAFKAAKDEAGYTSAYNLYSRQLQEYKKFSKTMGILPQMERVYPAFPGGFHKWRSEWGGD